MRCRRAWPLALLSALLIAPPAFAQAQSYSPADLDAAFDKDTLIIHAAENACYRFDIWLARQRAQQMRGLMFVRNLPEFTGMLFIYPEPGGRSMWMKNTYISLDIVFIRDDGRISSIIADAEPLNLRSLSSREPVTYVLELGGGVAAALGIGSGDRVDWSGLDPR
jgi:uncharacterized membrane protein (UPF0127 family)